MLEDGKGKYFCNNLVPLSSTYTLYTMSKVSELSRINVSLSRENYNKVKKYGFAGESLNDAISRILEQVKVEKQ